jgi:hypothetical protein
MKNEQTTSWHLACEDPQWWVNERGDVVRGPRSYRAGGWWLLPVDRPDRQEFDIGPFKTKREAMSDKTTDDLPPELLAQLTTDYGGSLKSSSNPTNPDEVRRLRRGGMTLQAIANVFGVSKQRIQQIVGRSRI